MQKPTFQEMRVCDNISSARNSIAAFAQKVLEAFFLLARKHFTFDDFDIALVKEAILPQTPLEAPSFS